MPDMVRLAIERNLVNAERVGDADRVKKIKARLAQHDKASAPKPEPAPKSVTTTTSNPKSVTTTTTSNLVAPNKGKK